MRSEKKRREREARRHRRGVLQIQRREDRWVDSLAKAYEKNLQRWYKQQQQQQQQQ